MSLSVHDPELGMRFVANNRNLYLKVLGKFVDQQEGAAWEVQTVFEQGDLETAHRLVHTLKGLAGTLGMPQLQETSSNIDVALKAGQDIGGMIPQLIVDLGDAIQVSRQYLDVAQ